MARPKGSGRGLVLVGLRLEPEVYDALQEWRAERGDDLSEAEALRWLVRFALEKGQALDKKSPEDEGYAAGLRQGRADWHRVINETWEKINKGGFR